jgi:hypothetical protein
MSDATDNDSSAILDRLKAIEDRLTENTRQLSREDLKTMSPQAIVAAQKNGQLKDILNP